MMKMLKSSKVIVIWLIVVCLLMPVATPILAFANNDVPAIIMGEEKFELSNMPFENELGVMVNAEDIAKAFAYEYQFDSINNSFEIIAPEYGKVTLMHNATKFYSGDYEFECLPYFYVENSIPMIEVGFFCEMFNSSYEFDGDKLITLYKDVPQQREYIEYSEEYTEEYSNEDMFELSLMSEEVFEEEIFEDNLDIQLMEESVYEWGMVWQNIYQIYGEVNLPADFKHTSDINVRLVVTPCSEKKVWQDIYGANQYVTSVSIGRPVELGEVVFSSGENRVGFMYNIPRSVLESGYLHYTLSYEVLRDDTCKLWSYGAYKDDYSVITLASSPMDGAFSLFAHRFDIQNESNSAVINIPSMYSEEPTILKGDILEDGVINAKDAIRLAQYLARWDISLSQTEREAADIVYDGTINAKDAVKLAQYLARWDISLDD